MLYTFKAKIGEVIDGDTVKAYIYNEYPFDKRIYEAGGSLPAWGIGGEIKDETGIFYDQDWPTRFCYECRTRFAYAPQRVAFGYDREGAINIANEQARQVNQWEATEGLQDSHPYVEWGWWGFIPMMLINREIT